MNSLNKWWNYKILYPYLKRIWFNFKVVDRVAGTTPYLMRSRWPSGHFIKYLIDEYGLETMISLEDRYDEDIDPIINSGKLNHIKKWDYFSAKQGPSYLMTQEIIEWMKKEMYSGPSPYLVRCQAGADRTGYFCAIYRIKIQGWSKWRTKLEMLLHAHFPFKYPKIWEAIDNWL